NHYREKNTTPAPRKTSPDGKNERAASSQSGGSAAPATGWLLVGRPNEFDSKLQTSDRHHARQSGIASRLTE
ncbi:hypothetical protein THAOC_05661, partial [Thalassiosira oceanica]